MSASAPDVQLGELSADLCNDGAFFEKAPPISFLLDLDHQTAVHRQIVVEAVIGAKILEGGIAAITNAFGRFSVRKVHKNHIGL